MREFKVGDRVNHSEYGLGTIKYDDGSDVAPYAIETDEIAGFRTTCGGHCKQGRAAWCNPEDLELIERPRKFKKGDYVYIKPTSRWNPGQKGVIKRVVDRPEETLPYFVNGFWISESELELIEQPHEFKVGDRVECTADVDGVYDTKGRNGMVIGTLSGTIYNFEIKFDDDVNGHNCYGKCEYGHGLNVNKNDLKPLTISDKIIITSDGTTTTAKRYENGKLVKTSTAKRSAEDTYRFERGADIAYNRLLEREVKSVVPDKPKYYSGKVVCVDDSGQGFKKGKIYEVTEGKLVTIFGVSSDPFNSFEEINRSFTSQFIELVED